MGFPAEGVGFEPTVDRTADNGFRDHGIRRSIRSGHCARPFGPAALCRAVHLTLETHTPARLHGYEQSAPRSCPSTKRAFHAGHVSRGRKKYDYGRDGGRALSPSDGGASCEETLWHAVRASVNWSCALLQAEAAACAWCLRCCALWSSALRPSLSAVASAAARSLTALSRSPGWSRRSSVWA
jgi:hypothetical protein